MSGGLIMELDKKLECLQMIYAGVLADAVNHFGKAGILEEVTAGKRDMQMAAGKATVQNFGITAPEEAFTITADIFGCADWTVTHGENSFAAEASRCVLCTMAKKMNAPSPCRIYCLNPLEGMVKGLNPELEFRVEETLWDGAGCRVIVK